MPTTRSSRKRSALIPITPDSATPPKRTFVLPPQSLLELPEPLIMKILQHLDIHHLGLFSQTSHLARSTVLTFCRSRESLPVLLPSKWREDLAKVKHQGVDLLTVRHEGRRLGLLVKRLTCLLPTRDRLNICSELLSRLLTKAEYQLVAVCIHQLIRGWADDEMRFTASHVFKFIYFHMRLDISWVLNLSYLLGSNPDLETKVKNFLGSMYYKEVGPDLSTEEAQEQKRLWLQSLLSHVSPDRNPAVIGRTLLLLSTPVRQQGVQWVDHEEAIPATLVVSTSRYNQLVTLLNTLRRSPLASLIPEVLTTMFMTPGPWLLENVGSVLLLLGQRTSRDYLSMLTSQVANRQDSCSNCFSNVATAISGLAMMTARFRWSLNPVFERLDEVAASLPSSLMKQNMLTALWEVLAGELTDLRQAEGEEWVQEGGMYLFQVIRMVGQKLTEKAYIRPSSRDNMMELRNEE